MTKRTRALKTWAEIADFLGVSKSVAQKAAKLLGMPVHRPFGENGCVRADPVELEEWQFKK